MNKYQNYLDLLKFKEFNKMQLNCFFNYENKANLLLNAKTGSGKTYAYLIPVLNDLATNKIKNALIILPTNELITQVINMAQVIKGDTKIINGSSLNRLELVLDEFRGENNKILIITPSKMLQLINIGLKKDNFDTVIFDEADMMYEGDFLNLSLELLDIFKDKRKIIVSATIKINSLPQLKSIIGQISEVGDNNPYLGQSHYLINADYSKPINLLEELIKTINPYLAIIFTAKKANLIEIKNVLDKQNKKSIILSSENTLKERKKKLSQFNIDNTQYIIATDLYARGIDLEITDVINYDLPTNLDYFIHRSGRAARANREGNIYTIALKKDLYKINRLREKGIKFNLIKVKNNEVKVKDRNKLNNPLVKEIKAKIKLGKVKPNYKKKYLAKVTKEVKKAKVKAILKKKRANKFREDK